MPIDPVANFIRARAIGAYSSLDTVISIDASDFADISARIPAAGFNVTWWDSAGFTNPIDDPNREIVRVLGYPVAGQIEVLRGQDGTVASAKAANGTMVYAVTRHHMDDLVDLSLQTKYHVITTEAVPGKDSPITFGANPSFTSDVDVETKFLSGHSCLVVGGSAANADEANYTWGASGDMFVNAAAIVQASMVMSPRVHSPIVSLSDQIFYFLYAVADPLLSFPTAPYVGFRYHPVDNTDGMWHCICDLGTGDPPFDVSSGVVVTAIDTAILPIAGIMREFVVKINRSPAQVEFRIDGAVVAIAPLTGPIPSVEVNFFATAHGLSTTISAGWLFSKVVFVHEAAWWSGR